VIPPDQDNLRNRYPEPVEGHDSKTVRNQKKLADKIDHLTLVRRQQMAASTGGALVFPSIEWFQAIQELVNADPEFRRLGSIDATMGVKVGAKVFVVTFEAFECSNVREGT
jgi:hypothetical protein